MGMIVDARTVVFVSLCAFAIMAVFLAWSWRAQRLGDALGWWSAAFALATVDAALLFVSPDTLAPFDWVDEVVFLGATFTLWFGFRSLNDQRLPLAEAVVLIALFVGAVNVLDLTPRLTHAVSLAIACVVVVFIGRDTLLRPGGGRSWRVAAIALVGLHGTILAVRTFVDDGDATDTIMTIETISEVLFMIEPMLMPMALGYVFLGLAYDRQHRDAVAETERDPLTGLLNRRGLERRIAQGGEAPLAVIIADIDHFKRVNDTHCHDVGDRVIVAVAERLAAQVRTGDSIARLGGEEFCVVMHAAPDAAVEAAERMRRAVAASPVAGADDVSVTASFGVAVLPAAGDAEAVTAALKSADEALYDAKRGGRNRVAAAPMRPDQGGPRPAAQPVSSST